ncbi:MAG: threonine/serine dehydratase [Planctomycetota bacterium]
MTESSIPPAIPPDLERVHEQHKALARVVLRTPLWPWRGRSARSFTEKGTKVSFKLELLQHAGSFKARGALTAIGALDPAQLSHGVVAVSQGNHAMAVSFAAGVLGTSAKVIMPSTASPARRAGCLAYGAEVILAADMNEAFAMARELQEGEQRTLIHPYEGESIALGTATMGWEIVEQMPELEAIIIPVGGGGMAAGIASVVKRLLPHAQCFGVEPFGADSLYRSFQSGQCESIPAVTTIADSLGAPHAAPYSFGLCKQFLDDVVRVEDDEIRRAMAIYFRYLKLATEPAGATALAGLLGPLKARVAGKQVCVITCGSNIDHQSYTRELSRGMELLGD